MQLADKKEMEGSAMFDSPRIVIPLGDGERRELLSSLSIEDVLILGSSSPVSENRLPLASTVLDWVNILGLVDLSCYGRVVLVDPSDEEELLEALDADTEGVPVVLYSASDALCGLIPRNFLRWDPQEEMLFPAFELDDDMVSSALGAFLSSAAYKCAFVKHSLATGTAGLSKLAREDLRRAVKTMSCGTIDVPSDAFSCLIASIDLPVFEETLLARARESTSARIVAQIEAFSKVRALRDLLDSAYGSGIGLFDGFTVSREQMFSGFRRTDRDISDRLRANGMESFLDAALSGVPVDDLFA